MKFRLIDPVTLENVLGGDVEEYNVFILYAIKPKPVEKMTVGEIINVQLDFCLPNKQLAHRQYRLERIK